MVVKAHLHMPSESGGGKVTKPRPMDLGHPGSSGGTAERKGDDGDDQV